jgi:hypothetical protein
MKIIQSFLFLVTTILLLLTTIQKVNSQNMNGAFIMSSVGSIPNLSNNSMAVNFKSTATCFGIQNGAAILIAERGKGKFTNYCIENVKMNALGLRMYPNPVVTKAQVKLSKLPPVDEVFNWSIWTSDGLKITGEKTTGYELFQGKMLDLRGLHSGIFILQVESNNYKEIVKFIKAR